MEPNESIERLAALVRMDSDPEAPVAHCEECGSPIPVEYARCSSCESEV